MKDVDSPARVRGTRTEQWVPDVSVGKERRGIKKIEQGIVTSRTLSRNNGGR
jgi:hypothetical protein